MCVSVYFEYIWGYMESKYKVKWSAYEKERTEEVREKKKLWTERHTRTTMRRIQNKQILNITSCSTNTWIDIHTRTNRGHIRMYNGRSFVRSFTLYKQQHCHTNGEIGLVDVVVVVVVSSTCSIGDEWIDGWHGIAKYDRTSLRGSKKNRSQSRQSSTMCDACAFMYTHSVLYNTWKKEIYTLKLSHRHTQIHTNANTSEQYTM